MKRGAKPLGITTNAFIVAASLRVDVATSAADIAYRTTALSLRQIGRILCHMRARGYVSMGVIRGTWLLTRKGEILMGRSVQRFEEDSEVARLQKKQLPDAWRTERIQCEKCCGTGEIPAPCPLCGNAGIVTYSSGGKPSEHSPRPCPNGCMQP